MNRPMCRNSANPLNPAVLRLRSRVQPLGDCFGDDRPLVLLQRVNLGLDIGGQRIDLGTFSVKEIGGVGMVIFFISCQPVVQRSSTIPWPNL